MNTRFGSSLQKLKWNEFEFSTAFSGHYSSFIRVLRVRVASARIFGLFFHDKTCGLAEKSKFEDFGTIFEKPTDSARSGFEAVVQKYLLGLHLQKKSVSGAGGLDFALKFLEC
jgi:hypothetical protein